MLGAKRLAAITNVNGKTIRHTLAAFSTFWIFGQRNAFPLAGFHFHCPSIQLSSAILRYKTEAGRQFGQKTVKL